MKLITVKELTSALVEAALPSIEAFVATHPESPFVGLGVETLVEMRYFHLAAQPLSAYEDVCKSRGYLDDAYLLPSQIGSNCQEWEYFDFNCECDAWNEMWEKMERRIAEYDQYVHTLESDESSIASQKLSDNFWHASVAAHMSITASAVYRAIPKSNCFVTFIYEHHDVF